MTAPIKNPVAAVGRRRVTRSVLSSAKTNVTDIEQSPRPAQARRRRDHDIEPWRHISDAMPMLLALKAKIGGAA